MSDKRRSKGRWATQATGDLGDLLQSLMYAGQMSTRREQYEAGIDNRWFSRINTMIPNNLANMTSIDQLTDVKNRLNTYSKNLTDNSKNKDIWVGSESNDYLTQTVQDIEERINDVNKFHTEFEAFKLNNDTITIKEAVVNDKGDVIYSPDDKIPLNDVWAQYTNEINSTGQLDTPLGKTLSGILTNNIKDNLLANDL